MAALKIGTQLPWLFLIFLFEIYPGFKEIVVSRFAAGHAHGNLDRIYDYNKDTMELETKVEDLMFTFDFTSFIAPHMYSQVRGHGSSGQYHVFRFRRLPGMLRHMILVQVLAPALFKSNPSIATRTFLPQFPQGHPFAVRVNLSCPFLPGPPAGSGIVLKRRNALINVQGIISSEESGPAVEPITYPGYSDADRKRLLRGRSSPPGRVRGRGRGCGGHGRGRGRGRVAAGDVSTELSESEQVLL